MKNSRPKGLRTWIEIDKKAVAENYRLFRSLISRNTKLMAVVKSNAYGHGLIGIAKEMEKNGVDWLGVDSVLEALDLRDVGIKKPILVMGYTPPEMIGPAAQRGIDITISNIEHLYALKKANLKNKIKIHIKVDTGMSRQGFLVKDKEELFEFLSGNKKNQVAGLSTHFAMSDRPESKENTTEQIKIFKEWAEQFNKKGFDPIKHAANSAAAILYPESHFDMVRIGIGNYGIWPSKELEGKFADKISLKPALSWKTIISEIKELPAGAKIGYDSTETLSRLSKIAICPIGYWHGYPRAFSSVGHALAGGVKSRVIGRVSMDMITIDVTDARSLQIGDEVVLIGEQSGEKLTAENIAELINMSRYELITRINPLIRRIYK